MYLNETTEKLRAERAAGKNTVSESAIDIYEPHITNAFMRAFLSDTILRQSCYNCPTKQGKAHSDITIADFGGINHIDPSFDDDKGCVQFL